MGRRPAVAPLFPVLLNKSELQRVYFGYEEIDKWGDVKNVKMQTSDAFKEKFNVMVYELLMHCIATARARDSSCVGVEDLPELEFEDPNPPET